MGRVRERGGSDSSDSFPSTVSFGASPRCGSADCAIRDLSPVPCTETETLAWPHCLRKIFPGRPRLMDGTVSLALTKKLCS